MSKSDPAAPWHSPSEFGPCACTQIRRTARKISALYDAALTESGLTITQHALLVNVGRHGAIGRTALAALLGMDRTTLTRNLKPLERSNLIVAAPSNDRRERLLTLSAAGVRKLRQSYALWNAAQARFLKQLGDEGLGRLRAALTAAETTAEALIGQNQGHKLD
jgi:DNA-binding MarR family transcriptional regulator